MKIIYSGLIGFFLLCLFNSVFSIGQPEKIVSPEDYGAIGDGVHDDTQAIQLAVNSGYSVRFNSRTYRIEGTVTVNKPIDLNGNNCTITGSGAPRRRVVFAIKSPRITIHDFNGRFEQDSKYSGDNAIAGNNIILFSIFSDNVDIRNITTKGAFSTVFLTDTDSQIKNNIKISNITALDGNMNIFLRYAKNVEITDLNLSISSYCSEFHPIYVCSCVRDVTISNVLIKGYKARDLISFHPSSSTPEKYNIKNIKLKNITLDGLYEYGLVFRYCQNIIVDGITMNYDKTAISNESFCSVVEGYKIKDITIKNANCEFLGNLCKITEPHKCRSDANVVFNKCKFIFNYTPKASHALIQYACNTRFYNCDFYAIDDFTTTLIVGHEKTLNASFVNCVFKPKTKGWLADMRSGCVTMKKVCVLNSNENQFAVKMKDGELTCIDCKANAITKSFSNNPIKKSKRNKINYAN